MTDGQASTVFGERSERAARKTASFFRRDSNGWGRVEINRITYGCVETMSAWELVPASGGRRYKRIEI